MKLLVSLQKRTREKLVNVLSLCGQEVGLTKNPSVCVLYYELLTSVGSTYMYYSSYRV